MTQAVLTWQALIFITIGIAGRRRGWVVGFWIVWTCVQITALPLSILQFATIAAAAAVFRSRIPASQTQPPSPAVSPQPTANSARPAHDMPGHWTQSLQAGAERLARHADEFNQASADRLERVRLESEFRRAAGKEIKTEGFSCVLEEQVMKEALARDQALTRDIQSHLAGDPVLADLYRRSLARLPAANTVQERQISNRHALQVARSKRELLDELSKRGPQYREHFANAMEAAKAALKGSASDTGRDKRNTYPIILGRHVDDWLADIEGRRPNSTVQTLLSTVLAAREPDATTKPAAGLSTPPPLPARDAKLPESAYVTRHTFTHLAKNWLLPPPSVSKDELFDYIYSRNLAPILNRWEAQRLYVQRAILEGRGAELRANDKGFSGRYVFRVAPPKYHRSAQCELLRSDFVNYLVPPEIEAMGEEKMQEFQRFCEENKHLIRDKSEAVFWTHVGAHFRVPISPQRVLYSNSGIQEVSGPAVDALKAKIESIIEAALALIVDGNGRGAVERMRYAPSPGRALAQLEDPVAKEAVGRFFGLKRELLDQLLEFYKRSNAVEDLAVPLELLRVAGLEPCKGCSSGEQVATGIIDNAGTGPKS